MILADAYGIGGSGGGYAVGWLTLALINSGLAQGKRRSGIVWFLISLLLGPVATFLVVIYSAGPDREYELEN